MGTFKRTGYFVKLITALTAAFAALLLTGRTASAAEEFNCFTYDDLGNIINGYEDQNGDWYLFCTSSMDITATVLNYSGAEAVSADAGVLDAVNCCVENGFSANGGSVELTLSDSSVKKVTVMQSGLPSIQIKLNGVTLDRIHADKNIKYGGNDIIIRDPSDSRNDLTGTIEIKGRGNTTWKGTPKKPYQIKFSSKTKVLGMPKAKKWILLANYVDESLMLNMLAYDLGRQIKPDVFTPRFEYADLWIDGDYLGNYIIGEKVEIGSNRVDLNDPLGCLMEYDLLWYKAEPDYFILDNAGIYVLKESVTEDDPAAIGAAMDDFRAKLERLVYFIRNSDRDSITLSELNNYIDVDSCVYYYLVNDFFYNADSNISSFFWYTDGSSDILHMGPVWDLDKCGMVASLNTDKHRLQNNLIFADLLEIPSFRSRIREIYSDNRAGFAALPAKMDILYNRIKDSAAMNRILYTSTGIGPIHSTYEECIELNKTWFERRYSGYDCYTLSEAHYKLSSDLTEITFTYDGLPAAESVTFTVSAGDEGETVTAQAVRSDGAWKADIDRFSLPFSGVYKLKIAENGNEFTFYPTALPEDTLSVSLTDGSAEMETVFLTANSHDNVLIRVTSPDGAVSKGYSAEAETGGRKYSCTVPLNDFGFAAGTYDIRVYSGSGLLTSSSLYSAGGHTHSAVSAEDRIAPTCTEEGKEDSMVCRYCGETVAEGGVIPAAGHIPVLAADRIAPTCTENGRENNTVCCICGDVVTEGEVIPATGHLPYPIADGFAPTCTGEGKEDSTVCLYCGETLSGGEAIPPLGHADVGEWLYSDTEHYKLCGRCGDVTGAGPHIEDGSTVTADPSGAMTYHCTVCGYPVRTEAVSAPEPDIGDTVPIYRLFFPVTGEHLYTTDYNEAMVLSSSERGWDYEGIAWYAPRYGTPVYRLYNPHNYIHHYTCDPNEVRDLISFGWLADNDGGPVFYSGGSVQINRLYMLVEKEVNEKTVQIGLHHHTANAYEYSVLPVHGWEQEGESFRAVALP